MSWAREQFVFEEIVEVAPKLIPALAATADPRMALRNWDRYVRAAWDRLGVLHLMEHNPDHLQFLAQLFAASQFFSDIVVRNPEYLEWCLVEARMESEKPLEEYRRQLHGFVRAFGSSESRRRALCRFKRRELLRIGVRDLQQRADIMELCRELTNLAEAACELALEDSLSDLMKRYGQPAPPPDVKPDDTIGFAVLAMGKFGGRELNFSSDIDLIFVYDTEGTTAGRKDGTGHVSNRITKHEFYCKLGTAIIQYLDYSTIEGVLYRVDARLRPDGASGAIARSLPAYVAYLADQARSWEKIAYLKARCVAGDRKLAARFEEVRQNFVFFGNSPQVLLPEVARLKRRIDHEALDPRTRKLDIKRGPGGIREVEFISAALQLLHGGNDKSLRVRATLEAMELLAEKGKLQPDKVRRLREAYLLFRQVEHCLQMMNEQQTHALPEDDEERQRLAVRCHFESEADLQSQLSEFRGFVREQFEALFHEEGPAEKLDLVDYLVSRDTPEESVLEELAPFGIGTVEGFRALRELVSGSREFAISRHSQQWLERVFPQLLEQLQNVAYRENAIRHFTQLLRSHHSVTSTYELIQSHPWVLRMLVRVLGFGSLPARLMVAHPEYLDQLLLGEPLRGTRSPAYAFDEEYAARVGRLEVEKALGRIRQFKDREALFLAVREIMDVDSARESAATTTELAKTCLSAVIDVLSRDSERRDGRWCIIALGSFGGEWVHVCGDLDVAVFHEAPENDRGAAEHYSNLAGRILSTMSAVSPDGQLWKVDARLRPDGVNAPLSIARERAERYYREEAGIWEFQSMTRAQFLAGDEEFGREILGSMHDALRDRSPLPDLAKEIHEMRVRLDQTVRLPRHAKLDLKRGPGGIVDVEFLVQYFQLAKGIELPALRTPRTDEALEVIRDAGLMEVETVDFILEHHHVLRTVQRAIRLLWETPKDLVPGTPDRLGPLARALDPQLQNAAERLESLGAQMITMREIFDSTLSN
ncbi:bifunctional [glutamate--ammonia ligase]-adenylyl-L-tyrosine phosphorylase/[glutamate--ammonia-ligase] adenylyltransferase [bacterium]|nr:bifunctional [glutamate--ammonia ligase]-adenylyl-L-tyrosine phosphorylase/[glutamate--ammonia-ligase] adenylyltransferase [bacterium]